jgi:hypothetical protein
MPSKKAQRKIEKKETCLTMPNVQVPLNCRHQGREDYPCEERENENPREIEKERYMGAKRSHCCIPLYISVSGLIGPSVLTRSKSILPFF